MEITGLLDEVTELWGAFEKDITEEAELLDVSVPPCND